MDSFKIISKNERKKLFYHGLQNKFKLIDKINDSLWLQFFICIFLIK
jgi:hypothetical protein